MYGLWTDRREGYGWMGGFAKVDNVFGWMDCLQGRSIGLGVSMGG
jgi:hypothetical protein